MIEDEFGNKIFQKDNFLFLQLIAESFPRNLGKVNRKDRSFTVYKNYDKHLFRKNNSFGFNSNLLEKFKKTINIIILKTDKKELFKIPVQFILDNGSFMFFKEQGFEKQIFIELDKLQQFKT